MARDALKSTTTSSLGAILGDNGYEGARLAGRPSVAGAKPGHAPWRPLSRIMHRRTPTLGVLVHNPDCEPPGGVTSLYSAPQPTNPDPAGQMVNGFDPAQYPNGTYFGTNQQVANEYWNQYQNGMQQINMPTGTYNGLVNNGIIQPDTLLPADQSVYVPPDGIGAFNAAMQEGPPNVYVPNDNYNPFEPF
jgi:hypothetical protein